MGGTAFLLLTAFGRTPLTPGAAGERTGLRLRRRRGRLRSRGSVLPLGGRNAAGAGDRRQIPGRLIGERIALASSERGFGRSPRRDLNVSHLSWHFGGRPFGRV